MWRRRVRDLARHTTMLAALLAALALTGGCSDDPVGRPGSTDADVGIGSDGPRGVLDGGTDPRRDAGGEDGTTTDAAAADATTSDGPAPPPPSTCTPLPPPTGTTVTANPGQAAQLAQIVAQAASGTTILLADGTYTMSGSESQRRLTFGTPGVTLRSASGQRDKVIIDGEYQTKEMIFIRADDVTIAHLTLRRAEDHLIHVTGASSKTIVNTRLHDLVLVDSGEQFVKVNSDGQQHYVDDGRLECSLLRLTAQGRPNIETNPGGCYTGGIDAHGARGWAVRLNRFEGIYCDNGSLAEHAVHFWSASRGTLVERNIIVDCARGVGFGLVQSGATRSYADDPYPGVGYVGHYDGLIRNNVIHAAIGGYYDTGIELAQARGARVYHNTVASQPSFSSIDYRFANTLVTVRNNLTAKVTQRDGAQGTIDHNLQSTPASLFIDAAQVDYRLKAAATQAIDQGAVVPEAGLDLAGQAHDVGPPDLGAYERTP